VEVLRDVADERRPWQTQALEDRRRLQDNLMLDGASLRSPREDAGGIQYRP